ncbi:transcription factor Opi1-domain-containing protein [Umbelopsis sp. PMI_123]|nr:transcription factor Opi1-domain-containing protein [Umbelopsis sp. PMI_123]
MSTPSKLSIEDLCRSNEEHDAGEDARNADHTMPTSRHGHSRTNSDTSSLPSLSNESTTHNTPLTTPTATDFAYDRFPSSKQASSSSWMNSAYKAYGQSRVMRYVESGVRSLAVPIYGRIGKSFRDETPVDKIDMQLRDDKNPVFKSVVDDEDMPITKALANTSLEGSRRRAYRHQGDSGGGAVKSDVLSKPRISTRSLSPHRSTPYSTNSSNRSRSPVLRQSSSQSRSRWQQLVVGAGSAAGTTAAVISEESMKCLKYCLSWLQYAVNHIDQQMSILRNFLVSLATSSNPSSSQTVARPSPSVLSSVKKEIIDTLRKVVEVVSKYAGSSLPAHAKSAVRSFIINLPGKWALVNDMRSTTVSPAASPQMRPHGMDTQQPDSSSQEAAVRLLQLGGESVEMLHSVSGVFSDTIDRAELWLDRLRTVKMSSAGNEDIKLPALKTDEDYSNISLPSLQSVTENQLHHRPGFINMPAHDTDMDY